MAIKRSIATPIGLFARLKSGKGYRFAGGKDSTEKSHRLSKYLKVPRNNICLNFVSAHTTAIGTIVATSPPTAIVGLVTIAVRQLFRRYYRAVWLKVWWM